MSFRDDYASMLRGMLSPSWQKPSERKIEVLLKKIEDNNTEAALSSEAPLSSEQSPSNRRRLTALVTASTKLDTASGLVKNATVDIAASGLLPVQVQEDQVQEDLRKIASDLDAFIQRRITSTIGHIP